MTIIILTILKTINNKSLIINNDRNFSNEIDNFNEEILLNKPCDKGICQIWKYMRSCISGYLIKESYEKTKINRLENFINFEKQKETAIALPTSNLSAESETTESSNEIPIIKEDEFIELRDIRTGSIGKVVLIYHIEREELYALKKKLTDDTEIDKLRNREIDNYSKVQHPLMAKLIGIGQNKKYLIIEFINGRTLLDIKKLQLDFSDKITIFFELLIIFEFLHRKGFIYRDLKPNNIIIDENKTVF